MLKSEQVPVGLLCNVESFFLSQGSVIVGDYVSIQASVDFDRNQTRV